ncbi:MAG: zf-HC2 domain-containing protein [Nitrospiraceae bacterium]|nr:zf-HC2 domain-containing protein [Nitrospiraceae bacterium]
MKCSKAHKLTSLYIDGELPERDVKTLEDHMKACHKCRAEFEEGMELHNLFTDAEKFEAPFGFHARVMANVSSRKIRESSRISVFARLAEAVVIIVVIVLGVLSGNFLIKGYSPDKAGDVTASLSLDIFASAPPGSLGGVYLAMTEVSDEK